MKANKFTDDEYANLNARAVSEGARALVERLYSQVAAWELECRVRFADALNALKALALIEVIEGQGRYKEVKWGKNDVQKWQDRGWARRFSATDALVRYAEHDSVSLSDIDDHFRPEVPRFPLVLRTAPTYTDGHKHRGMRIEFERVGKALRLEEEVRALNAFLANVEISNATHYYFIRGFNEGNFEGIYDWARGGRLYSQGGARKVSYQQLNEEERAKITESLHASLMLAHAISRSFTLCFANY